MQFENILVRTLWPFCWMQQVEPIAKVQDVSGCNICRRLQSTHSGIVQGMGRQPIYVELLTDVHSVDSSECPRLTASRCMWAMCPQFLVMCVAGELVAVQCWACYCIQCPTSTANACKKCSSGLAQNLDMEYQGEAFSRKSQCSFSFLVNSLVPWHFSVVRNSAQTQKPWWHGLS